MQFERAPITGETLRWAISESGISDEDVARRLKVDIALLHSWINESEQPTKAQLSAIAKTLRRPSAMFFLPTAPPASQVTPKFRSAFGMHGRQLTPEERQWVRGADELQEIGSWTLQRLDRPPARLNRYTLKDDPARAADEERRRLRVAVSEQLDWPNPTTALRTWRSRIEDEGVLTFQFAIGAERVPGFSLWDDYTPVITINRGYNLASRIFTLFHEYAHLLQRRDDVLDTAPTPSQRQSIDNLERWCEQFAACLLLPADALLGVTSDAFDFRSTETVIAFDQVKKLADQFHVSYQAMARRLEEIELAPTRLVAQVDRMVSQRRREPGFSAVRRLELRTQTYGERLPRILIEGVESDVLNRLDVLDALDIQAGEFGLLQAQLGDTSV